MIGQHACSVSSLVGGKGKSKGIGKGKRVRASFGADTAGVEIGNFVYMSYGT